MTLTRAMSNKHDQYEVSLFKEFVDTNLRLKLQLYEDYHTERYLRGKSMTAVYIP